MLRLLFEELHVRLHQNDSEKIFLTLWRLKNMVADLKARTGIMSTHIQTGVDFRMWHGLARRAGWGIFI